MTEHITDTHTITVNIIPHGNVIIQNVNAPENAYENESFGISWDIVNSGGNDQCFTRIMQDTEVVLDSWSGTLTPGNTHTMNVTVAGQTSAFNAVIEAGYTTA